eukprot:GHRR01026733.1.p1 GENE.GHRR01026733.1~~GHRR01026733.1.p1  ORF type:complete len:124 (+),score=22.54 GHRR01026733.1:226-597(+)
MHNSADPHASMLPNGQIKVIGLGDPVMDVLFRVDYQFLSTIAERSGGCIPITHEEMVWLAQLTAGHAEPSRWEPDHAAKQPAGSSHSLLVQVNYMLATAARQLLACNSNLPTCYSLDPPAKGV